MINLEDGVMGFNTREKIKEFVVGFQTPFGCFLNLQEAIDMISKHELNTLAVNPVAIALSVDGKYEVATK